MDSDRNFLLGMAALQSGLIAPAQLAEAGTEWMRDRGRPFAEVLLAKGWVSHHELSTLEARVRDLERSTLEVPLAESSALGDGEDWLLGCDQADDRSTRSWCPEEDRDDPSAGLAAVLGDSFGARYINPVLHAVGGLGRVWRVYDTVLGREVAIKDLRPISSGHSAYTVRFVEEAKIAGQLQHPNIIPVHDLVDWTPQPFYTMRFLGDVTLKKAVMAHHGPRKPGEPEVWTRRRLMDAFLGVCNAIAFAHDRGIIHRDIKGQNVILGRYGEVIMLDWGLAKRLDVGGDPLAQAVPGPSDDPDRSMSLETEMGQAIGTPNYMSPEQAAGDRDRIGKASDVFGLGAMLYLILTGRPPFVGRETKEVLRMARDEAPPRPRSVHPDVPAALDSICMRAMERDPEMRYHGVTDLADDVRRWMADEPVAAHPDNHLDRAGRWARKHPAGVMAAAAVLLTSTVVGAIGASFVNSQKLLVVEQRNIAAGAKNVAMEDLHSAVAGVRDLLTLLRRTLPGVPGAEPARIGAANRSTKLVREVGRRHRTDESVRVLESDVFRESAAIYRLGYRLEDADRSYREALQCLDEVNGRERRPVDCRLQRAKVLMDYGLLQAIRGRSDEAGKLYAEALELVRAPDVRQAYPVDASLTEAQAMINHASLLHATGDREGAASLYAGSIQILEPLIESKQAVGLYRLIAAQSHHARGQALLELGRADEARWEFAEVIRRSGLQLEPAVANNDWRFLRAASELGIAQVVLGANPGTSEAQDLADHATDSLMLLVKEHPHVVDYRISLAMAFYTSGHARRLAGEWERSREAYQAARDQARTLTVEVPKAPGPFGVLARVSLSLAQLDAAESDATREIASLDEGFVAIKTARKMDLRNASYKELEAQLADALRRAKGVSPPEPMK